MRKLILATALAATFIPVASMAQSLGEVRSDHRELRHDQRDLRDARMRGDRHDARDARRDIRSDRREIREDWRDYRRAHPDVYRGPAYVGPRSGWRYRPVRVGHHFEPAFYGQRYWIDAGRYRLRPVASNLRWVRYGRDVVLVNIRTGRVLEVNRNFFY